MSILKFHGLCLMYSFKMSSQNVLCCFSISSYYNTVQSVSLGAVSFFQAVLKHDSGGKKLLLKIINIGTGTTETHVLKLPEKYCQFFLIAMLLFNVMCTVHLITIQYNNDVCKKLYKVV